VKRAIRSQARTATEPGRRLARRRDPMSMPKL
jgi:hypothetical protein